MSPIITVLHLTLKLAPGGTLRDMAGMAQASHNHSFRHILAGIDGTVNQCDELRKQGFEAIVLGDDLDGLKAVVSQKPLAVIVQRSGHQRPEWDRLIPMLKAAGAECIIDRNIFGYCDHGPTRDFFDLVCCNSLHTLWRHWISAGKPDVDSYLDKHRTLYCAVGLDPGSRNILKMRSQARTDLEIPENSFVAGSLCRADIGKIGYLTPLLLARLKRVIPEFYFVARSYPEPLSRMARKAIGSRFINLPETSVQDELASTLACMDVLLNLSAFGESFGIAIGEAMRCGLPVVTNERRKWGHNNAQIELVKNNITGFVANSPARIVEAVRQLASDYNLRKSMGQEGSAQFRRPPLAPESITAQLEMEIFKRCKVRITSGQEPEVSSEREQPSREETRRYILGYPHDTGTALPLCTLPEHWYNCKISALDLALRLKRKLACAIRS